MSRPLRSADPLIFAKTSFWCCLGLALAACGGPDADVRVPDAGGSGVDAGRATPDAGPACERTCDDGNPCTRDDCAAADCEHVALVGIDCNDGDDATFSDACTDTGACAGKPVKCPDETACARWTATGEEICEAHFTTDACDDGDPATSGDRCDGAGACAGTPVICPEETACTHWTPNGGETCEAHFTTDACDDRDPATWGDRCDGAGACAGQPVTCPEATACTTWAPNGTATCDPVFSIDPCDDDNLATSGDRCDGAGACAGTPVVCPAATTCATWAPNGSANCTPAFSTDACDDGSATTSDDRCDGAGACAGTPVVCPTAGACTKWTPNGTATCDRVFTTDACDDGSPATANDHCDGVGTCAGTPVTCPAATPCVRYDPNGTTTCTAVPLTGACDDGNACTKVDRCVDGACVGASPVDCGTPGRCQASLRCIPATGACEPVLSVPGTACDDGSLATSGDVCSASGSCAGTPVTCPASSACVSWNPNGTATCTRTVLDGAACDDSDPCTPRGTCSGATCSVPPPVTCANGTCNNGRCACASGWTGPRCDVDVDECATFGCGPGTCTNLPGSFSCTCPTNFKVSSTGTCVSAIPALEVAVFYGPDVEAKFGKDTLSWISAAFDAAKSEYDDGLSTPSLTLSLNALVRLPPSVFNMRRCNTSPTGSQCVGCWLNAPFPGCVGAVSTKASEFDIGGLLSDFAKYTRVTRASAVSAVSRGADVTLLLTNDDPPATIVGLAGVGVGCTALGSQVVSTRFSPTMKDLGIVIAHEIGHNINMNHDAPGSSYIMAPSASPNQHGFSPASLNDYRYWVGQSSIKACVADTAEGAWRTPICGNGRLDPGEECDPGIVADSCCTSACVLAAGCECANSQPCCASGRPKPAGTLCRAAAQATCDVADTCDGVNATCQDIVAVAGTACTDEAGFPSACTDGACAASRTTQCRNNSSDPTWTGCGTSTRCDVLDCTVPTSGTCGATYVSRVSDGTTCGSGSVCIAGACVPGSSYTTAEWRVGAWSSCANGTATRDVFCQSNLGVRVTDDRCWDTKPAASKSCTLAALSGPIAGSGFEEWPEPDDVLPVPHAPLIPGLVP